MNEILIDLGLSALFTALKKIPKDAKAKRQWRNAMLKLYRAIGAAYGDDEAFTDEVK